MGLHRALVLSGAVLLICGAAVAVASGPGPVFRSAGSHQTTTLDDPCPANQFPPIELAFASVISENPSGMRTNIRCTTEVRNGGKGRKGVKITLGGALFDGDGNPIRSLPTKNGRTNGAGQKFFSFPYAPPPPFNDIAVVMEGLLEGDEEIDSADTTCSIVQRMPCNNNPTQACLSGKRFKVEVDIPTFNGPGRRLSSNNREARFAFGNFNSPDLVVQLLNRCSNNDHFWVFASASTSVEFDLTVTDTFSGESRAYTNPGAFQPILDTSAFATCP